MTNKPEHLSISNRQARERTKLAEKRTEMSVWRTSLASERTFLAWTRTALGMMAFGFLIEKMTLLTHTGAAHAAPLHWKIIRIMSAAAYTAGVLIPALAGYRFIMVQKSLGTTKNLLSVLPQILAMISLVFLLACGGYLGYKIMPS